MRLNSCNGVIANWELLKSSPCIDASDSSNTYSSFDKIGNPRIIGPRIDMGAYEYHCGSIIPSISLSVQPL